MAVRPRYFWISIVLALSITAACTIAAVSGASSTTPALSPLTTIQSAASVQPPGIPMGMDYGATLFKADSSAISSGLADATGVGDSWIRVDLPWDGIQPADSRTTYDWTRFDTLVAAADARGLKMLVTIVDPPIWARNPACRSDEACEPASPQAYAAFAALAAKRYAPYGLHDWEIWNEENLGSFAVSANPAQTYTTLLQDSYIALHQADPKAVVLLGGLGMTDTVSSRNWISAYQFLSGVAQDGGLGYADAIGVHPYGWPYLPQKSPVFAEIDSGPRNLETILTEYGRGNVPFWITETGAPTEGAGVAAPDASAATANATHVTQAWQARIATATVAAATADPHIKALFWYTDVDLPASGLYFGLRTASGAQKPAYGALKTAIAAYRAKLE
jgi:polysaccharide biosynthesis protein PslG